MDLTKEQIIGGQMMQFAQEYHRIANSPDITRLLGIILRKKVEGCIDMLERHGYMQPKKE